MNISINICNLNLSQSFFWYITNSSNIALYLMYHPSNSLILHLDHVPAIKIALIFKCQLAKLPLTLNIANSPIIQPFSFVT